MARKSECQAGPPLAHVAAAPNDSYDVRTLGDSFRHLLDLLEPPLPVQVKRGDRVSQSEHGLYRGQRTRAEVHQSSRIRGDRDISTTGLRS